LSHGRYERAHRRRIRRKPAFSAAASFGISVSVSFPFGWHQGIRIWVTGRLVLMIRNFNPSKQTFTTNGQSPMPLLALMVW
jgi:hypothetical protein